ncbi:MAG: sterol desaturase family protein [Chitinophagaceae bacterium]|nr:sterol desaturase family protein [Chitinophagaceae bacterium]MCW5929428.1 sterol desaturase family protein [Chitinophagaceae bacterium]
MEKVNYLAFALPAFFIFLFIEYKISKYKKLKRVFRYESSVNNISIGIAERVLSLFITASFYSLFYYIYEHYALLNISNKWYIWVTLVLTTDFIWYWYHRLGHQVNLLWAAHIVHHQSEDFNLTVAARITVFQALIRNVFWCLLPWMGFHPSLVIFILILHGVYSFFTHTQVVGKLGWLEYIFITPSLHRVHHASNEKYLDRNYGDIFVFWDKMFGTFQAEEEKPAYGLTHPIKTYSFLWQHFHYYFEIWEAIKRTNGLKNKLKIIFGSPTLMDQSIRPILEKKWLPQARKTNFTFSLRVYLSTQVVVSFLLMCLITYYFESLNHLEKYFGTSFIIITLIICGGLLEQRRWIYYTEWLRVLIIEGYIFISLGYSSLVIISVILTFITERIFKIDIWYKRFVLNIRL